MNMRKIAAAIDGSDYSDNVLDKAIEYARLLNAEILLIYCHRKFPKLLGQPYRDQIISTIMDETDAAVGPFLEKLAASGVPYEERFMEGPAGTTIPQVAECEQCELIIMGSRGLSNIEGLLIGSVTNRVLLLAKCPVLVVR